jgi:ribonuclease HII
VIELGIDEAGYGPLLGPLVVTAWGVSRPDDGEDLWDSLEGAVSRTADANRVVVADSKQVYSPRRGLRRLEESVLSFLEVSEAGATSYGGLVRRIVPEDVTDPPLAWCDPGGVGIPLEAERGRLDRCVFLLRNVMQRQRVKPAFVSSRVVSPRRFNEDIASTGNKQVMLFSHVASLIKGAATSLGKKLRRVTVDKLGSTRRYARLLDRFFGGWSVRPESEERHMSRYTVAHPEGSFELRFMREGDRTEFLVALASMQSKYLREIEMRAFNAFWRSHAPEVRSTAGYYTDGRRFLKQIRSHADRIGIPLHDFVRVR